MKSVHSSYMQRALDLAARGKGAVSPNPCVGCVIVKNGKIIGEGYHRRYGGPHAEVFAFKAAGSRAKGATAYITLEPCTHWGKTPPCAPLVIESGIKKVVIAMKDPNPVVSGRGVQALRKAGIAVEVGVEEQSARYLNRSYLTWRNKQRPYVILKMAMTLDGKIATKSGNSKWISSEASRKLVHRLRSESDAVLVGPGTAAKDKPALTSHGIGRDPKKVLWDGRQNIKSLLNDLSKDNVSQLLVEGGGETAWKFVEQKLVDEILFFVAPKLIGGRNAKTPLEGIGINKMKDAINLSDMSVAQIGNDLLIQAFIKRN